MQGEKAKQIIGRLYKFFLDFLRNSQIVTFLIFGIKVTKKKIKSNWDTTTLVLKKAIDKYIEDDNKNVLYMGCGHVSLLTQYIKKNNITNSVEGADIYKDFVENAIFNAKNNNIDIRITKSDLFLNIDKKFDYIVFNPPYVPKKSIKMEYPKVGYSGVDGTATIRGFLPQAKKHLKVKGPILLGVNCYYVPFNKIMKIIRDNNHKIKDVVSRRFNTAKVFVLY